MSGPRGWCPKGPGPLVRSAWAQVSSYIMDSDPSWCPRRTKRAPDPPRKRLGTPGSAPDAPRKRPNWPHPGPSWRLRWLILTFFWASEISRNFGRPRGPEEEVFWARNPSAGKGPAPSAPGPSHHLYNRWAQVSNYIIDSDPGWIFIDF